MRCINAPLMTPKYSYIFLIALLILLGGCLSAPFQKPTVHVTDARLTSISLSEADIDVVTTITNPNPVGATLNRLAFDLYYQDINSEWAYLGHGEHDTITIRADGDTPVTVPVSVRNIPTVNAILTTAVYGYLNLRVQGSASIDTPIGILELPFDEYVTMTIP
jgi:LEA14-like dessication related protein